MLIDNHIDANKGKIKGCLYLEDIFGFCETFEEVTKNLGFHPLLKTANLQDVINTFLDDDIIVTINKSYLFVPNLLPSVETQLLFNEDTQNNYKISFDEYYTETRVISDMIVQHDIGSAQQVKAPKYFICAHQTKERKDGVNKNEINALFDRFILCKYYVEIDSIRYPRDTLLLIYVDNDYHAQ